jgi:hypothetical protein
MDLIESQLHSFIIKFWLEDTLENTKRTAWTGKITHVPGGEQRYIKSFDEMADFITAHLRSPRVDTPQPGRMRSLIRRLKRRRK